MKEKHNKTFKLRDKLQCIFDKIYKICVQKIEPRQDNFTSKVKDEIEFILSEGNIEIIEQFDCHVADNLLFFFLKIGEISLARFLLEIGFNPFVITCNNKNALHLIMKSPCNEAEKVKFIKTFLSIKGSKKFLHELDLYGASAIKYAVANKELKVIQELYESGANLNYSVKGTTSIEQVIKLNDLEILKYFVNSLGKDIINKKNNKGETMLDIAAKNYVCSIIEWLKLQKALPGKKRTLVILNMLTQDFWTAFDDSSFIIKTQNHSFSKSNKNLIEEQLTLKGISLLMFYFAIKEQNPNQPYVCNSIKIFKNFVEKLKNYDLDTEVTIIFQNPDISLHRCVLKIEKYNNDYHVILMDSAVGNNLFVSEMIKLLKECFLDKNVKVYVNKQNRQLDSLSCGTFAIKDARKMQKNKKLFQKLKQIKTKKNVFDNKTDFEIIRYNLPPDYMKSEQSNKEVENYIENQIYDELEEFKKTIEKYSYSENGKIINDYILYFARKYKLIIEKMLNDFSEKEIVDMTNFYNLNNYRVNKEDTIFQNKSMIYLTNGDKESIYTLIKKNKSKLE